MATVTISFEVKDKVNDLLVIQARREGVSKAVLGRRAVLAMLQVDADGNPRPTKDGGRDGNV